MYECVWFAKVPEGPWEPGWCFPLGYQLSRRYISISSQRPPISVCVPDRNPPGGGGGLVQRHMGGGPLVTAFCIDAHPTDNPESHWVVTVNGSLVDREKPDITVTPSMNAVGIYHGYLTHGVLGDDLG